MSNEEEDNNKEIEEVITEEESGNEESNTAKGQEAQSEDGSGEEENCIEEETEDEDGSNKSIDYVVEEMYEALNDGLNPEDTDIITKIEYRILPDQIKNIVVEFIINEKIAFRQIVDTFISIDESKERVIGTLKRNLDAYEKLSKEYLEKHNQEIVFMDQAEVTSIKKLEEVEKDGKTKK